MYIECKVTLNGEARREEGCEKAIVRKRLEGLVVMKRLRGMLEMLAVGTRVHYMCGRQVAQWRFKFALQLQLIDSLPCKSHAGHMTSHMTDR